jgi:phytol kinase
MLPIIVSLFAIFSLLVVCEILWRRGNFEPETARKLIHILVGSFIAFWPLYMSWQTIQLLSLALFIGVFLSYEFGVFGAIHHTRRRRAGELWFPLGVGLTALLTVQPWIFCIAILHLSIADGLAAVVGSRWGWKHYQIGEHTRSFFGSLAFLMTSLALCASAYIFLREELPGVSLAVFAIIPFLSTAVESISRKGLDNIFIPLSVTFALGLPTGTLVFANMFV